LQLDRPAEATTGLSACLKLQPGFSWLAILRGYASSKRLESASGLEAEMLAEAAATDYRKAEALLEQKPNADLRYTLFVNRGLLGLQRRDFEHAASDLRAATKLKNHYEGHALLARVYQKEGKLDKAIEQLGRAIERRPDLAALYRSRADLELQRGQAAQEERTRALRDLEQAIRLEKAGSRVLAHDHTARAQLLALADRELDALSACEAALAIVPDHDEAHWLRVRLLINLKRHQEAAASCDALLARGKASAVLYELRGLARTELRVYAKAIEDFT
jgi:tetratricopeptide (TPR) repeat protein